jgi:hypothetical protein
MNSGWMETLVPRMTEGVFKENFRVKRKTFFKKFRKLEKFK